MIHLSHFNGTQEVLINSVHQQRLSLHLCLLFFFLNSRILFLEILDENIIITNLLIIYINLNFMMRSILTVLQVELLKKILTFIQIFDLFNIFDRQLKKKNHSTAAVPQIKWHYTIFTQLAVTENIRLFLVSTYITGHWPDVHHGHDSYAVRATDRRTTRTRLHRALMQGKKVLYSSVRLSKEVLHMNKTCRFP